MRLITNFLFLTFIIGIHFQILASQQNVSAQETAVSETVYLHLDKTHYLLGDTLWFKAYIVNTNNHKLSGLSSVLFVELIQSNSKIIKEIKLRVTAGVANGNFILDNYNQNEFYSVRAYTNVMRDCPGRPSFYRLISIEPEFQDKAFAEIRFFPEGGTLITGLRTKIAFKSINSAGSSLASSGKIVDNSGQKAADFQTTHAGIGSFLLTPEIGRSYAALVNFADGTTQNVPLPIPILEGISLKTNNSNKDTLIVRVTSTIKSSEQSFNLIAHRDDQIYFSTEVKPDFPVQIAAIPKNRFPDGIIQITLIRKDGTRLSERLVFIRQPKEPKLDMTVLKYSIDTGNNTTIKIKTLLPSPGSFSVSVIKLKQLSDVSDEAKSIYSHLLLSSDLKDEVENPAYYFQDVNEETNQSLDNLMITQQYSEVECNVSTVKDLDFFKSESGLIIRGMVSSFGKAKAKIKLQLLSTELNLFAESISDSAGRFKFDGLNYDSTARFLIKAVGINKYEIKLDSVKSPKLPVLKKVSHTLNTDRLSNGASKEYIEAVGEVKTDATIRDSRQLAEVTVSAKKIKPVLEHSSNILGPGHADQVIMGDTFKGCISLAQCLSGKAEFISITPGGAAINNRRPVSVNGTNFMAVFVDGLQVDAYAMNNVNPNDIYSVEILRTGKNLAIYGSNAANGVVLITMRKGYEKDNEPKIAGTGPINFQYQGYSKVNEFHPPGLDIKKLNPNSGLIYWNPNIVTDKEGIGNAAFRTVAGNYIITIEGIDLSGNLYNYSTRISLQ